MPDIQLFVFIDKIVIKMYSACNNTKIEQVVIYELAPIIFSDNQALTSNFLKVIAVSVNHVVGQISIKKIHVMG